MKCRRMLAAAVLSMSGLISVGYAVNLVMVYRQAEASSPWLRQRLATRDAQRAAAHSAFSGFLPQVALTASGTTQWVYVDSYQSSVLQAQVTQNLFNLQTWGFWANADDTSLAQDMTYSGQEQTFMLDVAKAYFLILQSQDIVRFAKAKLKFLHQTLEQTKHKWRVGLGTITDYKQALANYDQSVADLIKDQNNLNVAIEGLREFTGVIYQHLPRLKSSFPFVKPAPANIAYWVRQAIDHNYDLQSQRYLSKASKQNVVEQYGNHLPVVQFVGTYARNNNNSSGEALAVLGYHQQDNATLALQLTWNIFEGGTLFASETQAARQYDAQLNIQENTYRTVVSKVRQDYLNVLAQVSQIQSYQEAVTASEASLKQFEAKYKVGTETIVNVLDQVQKLYAAKQNLASSQYQYIIDLLTLKQDVGGLSIQTLIYMNKWLA